MKIKNLSKNIFSILFALLLLLSIFDDVYATSVGQNEYTALHNEDTSEYEPEFEVLDGSNLGTYQTGKNETISICIENTGIYNIVDLELELMPGTELANLFLDKKFKQEAEGKIKPKEDKTFEFNFMLNDAVPEKYYNMNLFASYKNSSGDFYTKTIPFTIYVENANVEPTLMISNTSFSADAISSDSTTKMTLKVENKGDLVAKNVELKIDNFSPKFVYLVNDSDVRKLNTVGRGKSQDISFNIRANQDLAEDYELNVLIKYTDEIGQNYEKTQKILIPSGNIGSKNKLAMLEMNFDKAEYSVNGDGKATINLSLKNNGEQDLEDLKLELSSDGAIVFMSKYIDYIENLKAGESKSFSYTVISADPEAEGAHPVTAKLNFLSSKEDETKDKIQVTGVTCHKKAGAGDGKKPKIIISDYQYSGEKIVAGKEFELSLTVTNTSQSIGIKNVKMTHSSTDEVFIPVDSANSLFIESLAPGSSVNKTIKLTSKPDAAAKMYKVDFKAEYEDDAGKSYDEKGNPFTSEESIVLNLTQEIRLEIPDLKIPEFAMVGEGVPIETEFYNMGKAPLYNMMVKLEGDFDADINNYFVGNFEASKSDMFAAKVIPSQAGELNGKLIFEFEDESGNKDSIVKEFTINVEEGMAGMDGMMDGEMPMDEFDPEMMGDMEDMEFDENGMPIPKSKGLSTMAIIGIAVAAIIIIIVFIVVLKKRKKKKLEKFLLESDDEAKWYN